MDIVSNSTPGTRIDVSGTRTELVAWIFFNMWPSHFGLPVLLAILFFTDVKRGPALINLFITEMVAGFSSSVLLYAGKVTGPEPDKPLCLAHASLVYGIPPMTALSAFFLVLQMFLSIRSSYYGYSVDKSSFGYRIGRWVMIILPYVAFTGSFIATSLVGSANLQNVSRNRRFFYCSVKADTLTNTLGVFAALVLVCTLTIEVWTMVLFYHHWRSAKTADKASRWTDQLNLGVRIMTFAVYILICTVLSLLSIKAPRNPFPDLFLSAAGTVVILIFGTQLDILRALCFWKRSPRLSDSTHPKEKDARTDVEQPRLAVSAFSPITPGG